MKRHVVYLWPIGDPGAPPLIPGCWYEPKARTTWVFVNGWWQAWVTTDVMVIANPEAVARVH